MSSSESSSSLRSVDSGSPPATRSARRSGSSAASTAANTSGGALRETSMYWLNAVRTERLSAASCGVASRAAFSGRTCTRNASVVSVNRTTAARSSPSTSRRSLPSGSFESCRMRATVPTGWTSASPGSSTPPFFWGTRKSRRPWAMAAFGAAHRAASADEERDHHVREHHEVLQRDHEQLVAPQR